jgi:murein endopeptidase
MVNDARAQRNGLIVVPADRVQPGDIAMFDWQGDGTSDHVGIVETKPNSKGAFKCIEGNTSTSSDSDGGQVMRRDRNKNQVQVFIRVVE